MISYKYTDIDNTEAKEINDYIRVNASNGTPAVVTLVGTAYYTTYNLGQFILEDVQILSKVACTITIEATPKEGEIITVADDVVSDGTTASVGNVTLNCRYPLKFTVTPTSTDPVEIQLYLPIREVTKE